jgi:YhcH/YjgK/YiaL family protein
MEAYLIFDHSDNGLDYAGLHCGFLAAFRFLMSSQTASLPVGKHSIDGDRLLAIVGSDSGRGRKGARLEAHRKYIDIQLCVSGDEHIGWRRLADCREVTEPYDADRDIGFFGDAPSAWIALPPGHFMIFYPHDAHAPLAGEGPTHKVVMKVAVEW